MYDLLEKLEALIEKWENAPYTGDLTKAAKAVCAKELREVIGSGSVESPSEPFRKNTPSGNFDADYDCPF